jgi:TIR domain/NB-ARC domain
VGGIFINYRKDDSQVAAALIDRELVDHFGNHQVFLDCRSIPLGSDFADELLGRLRACSVLLVIIGPHWLTLTDDQGTRRIDNPQDWIRREIAEALTFGLRVVPVLIDKTKLPTEAELPQDIAELSRRQYVQLRYRNTTADLAQLVKRVIEAAPELTKLTAQTKLGANPVPRQLPAAPRLFTGRADELAMLTAVLDENGKADAAVVGTAAAIVVHGISGIGKTSLVVHWAHRVAEQFTDGLLFVDLRGSDGAGVARRPSDVVRDILLAFGIKTLPQGGDAQLALYRTLLADKRVLLVLDDARNADQVRPLLLPGVLSVVVATSRAPLAGLVGQGARFLPLDGLNRDEGRELLSRQVGVERATGEPAATMELVELCMGSPRALGTVASAAGAETLTDLAADLGRHVQAADMDGGDLDGAVNEVVAREQIVSRWAQARNKVDSRHQLFPSLTNGTGWLLDHRILIGVAVALCAAVVAVSTGLFVAAGLLGIGYFLLRFALLGAGLVLMERDGPARPLGIGAVTGSTVYLLVDALGSIHGNSTVTVWLELLGALIFATLLCMRWNPVQHRPRQLALVPPGSRPLSFAVLAGVLTWFILLFVDIPDEDGYTITLIDVTGALGAFFPLLLIGGVAVVAALSDAIDESQRLFAGAMIACYLIPEFFLLLGSLVLGQRFAYFGHGVYATTFAAPWFTTLQAVVVAVMAASTLSLLHRAQPSTQQRSAG